MTISAAAPDRDGGASRAASRPAAAACRAAQRRIVRELPHLARLPHAQEQRERAQSTPGRRRCRRARGRRSCSRRTARCANVPPHTSTAGQTPRSPRHPLIVTTSQAGTISDTNGSCRPGHHADRVGRNAGHRRQRQDRRADRAERDRRRVGDERQAGGVERREAQADQQRRADGDRRAESGRAFDERAERERDEQRLDPAIAREPADRRLDDLELAGLDGQVVEEDRVEDDPADRQEPVGRAVERRGAPRSAAACRRRRPTPPARRAVRRAPRGARAIRERRAPRAAGRSATPRPRC